MSSVRERFKLYGEPGFPYLHRRPAGMVGRGKLIVPASGKGLGRFFCKYSGSPSGQKGTSPAVGSGHERYHSVALVQSVPFYAGSK